MILKNSSKENTIVEKLEVANSFISRAVGLLGRSELPENNGMWIHKCHDIHSWFMRFTFDAVFVDSNLTVLSIYPNLKPWKLVIQLKADSVFELPEGCIKKTNIEVGDQLDVVN